MKMLFGRRAALAALLALTLHTPVMAEDWKSRFKEVRFGISSAENEEHAMSRYQPFARYMSEKLGVPVKVFRTSDYAGLVEAMRSDQLEFTRLGPANYALARKIMGERVVPLLVDVDLEGSAGYYSVLAVRAESPYRTLDDLRGKSVGWADPNSTSGYAFPTYFLRKAGYEPSTFFGKNAFSGSHENGVMALSQNTFDVVATAWNNEEHGNIQRMERKGMIPKGSVRVIWKSPKIPNSPWVVRGDIPPELRDLFVNAVQAMPVEGPEAWRVLTDLKIKGIVPARHEDYLDVIAVVQANDEERKKRSN
jgi:phosphonate transport system substrate-binding protein